MGSMRTCGPLCAVPRVANAGRLRTARRQGAQGASHHPASLACMARHLGYLSSRCRLLSERAWHGVFTPTRGGFPYGLRRSRGLRHSLGVSLPESDGSQPLCGGLLWGATADQCSNLSLSRLNHGQPGVQAHPEIVQGTAELHHEIADALLPQPDPVFHHATTLHTAVDMLNPQSAVVERLVGQLLLQGQLRTAWLLRRHEDLHLGERARQEARSCNNP